MKVNEFDYFLPEELIAQHPSLSRDHSRLLILNRMNGMMEHRHFYDLPALLRPGDLLVLNNTKVLPARLLARKDSGGQLEILLLHPVSSQAWSCLVKPAKRARVGTHLEFAGGMSGQIISQGEEGLRTIEFSLEGQAFQDKLAEIGELPLPPYIHEKPSDPQRYQTVYAEIPGAVAAPTAGLHFTPELFSRLKETGIDCVHLTLHVGLGTFRPVAVEEVEEHKMHSEYFEISQESARAITEARIDGRRIIAVGTTAVRVLETAADEDGTVKAGRGWTNIFIYPGYRFKAIDALITNFHLPRSTLLMLVSALAGRERILAAYNEAVTMQYRFFSFGDAMLVI